MYGLVILGVMLLSIFMGFKIAHDQNEKKLKAMTLSIVRIHMVYGLFIANLLFQEDIDILMEKLENGELSPDEFADRISEMLESIKETVFSKDNAIYSLVNEMFNNVSDYESS